MNAYVCVCVFAGLGDVSCEHACIPVSIMLHLPYCLSTCNMCIKLCGHEGAQWSVSAYLDGFQIVLCDLQSCTGGEEVVL